MKTPLNLELGSGVEVSLAIAPTCPSAANSKFAVMGLTLQGRPDLVGDGKLMQPLVLGPGRRQDNQATPKVYLAPAQPTDFLSTLPCQDQQANDVAELILAQCSQ